MYRELAILAKNVAKDRAFWKDGELWTAIFGGLAAIGWFYVRPDYTIKVRAHFGDLLNVTSITFGFALTALFFHVEAIGTWRNHPVVQRIAERFITSHVWTIACLLLQIAYILALWAFDGNPYHLVRPARALAYGLLVFMSLYCGCQILNHALTAWWAFFRRELLTEPEEAEPESQEKVGSPD